MSLLKASIFMFLIFLIKNDNICFSLSSKKCYEECSPNEVFVECDASCQPSCGFGFNDTKTFDCGCVHGCICKPGSIRSLLTKKCISIKKCNQIISESLETELCSKNEVYSETKAACQPSCFTWKFTGSEKCPVLAGCVCREGFVRDVTFGECISVEKCPNCRPNEIWQHCTNCTSFSCQNSCGSCECRPGYFEHKSHCIRDCAHRECFINEELSSCGNCENCCFNNPRTTCDKNGCYEGCFCQKGLMRNPLIGICVERDLCPVHCRPNEKFECRNDNYEKTCNDFQIEFKNTTQPCVNSCFCKQGFVRESTNAKAPCIHFTDCLKSP